MIIIYEFIIRPFQGRIEGIAPVGLVNSTHGYSDLALLGPFSWVVTREWISATTKWFDIVFLLAVGYASLHPRLCSCHRDAVLNVFFCLPWVITHGWDPITATRL